MKNKKRIIILVCIMVGVILLALATSYALFTFNVTKNSNFKVAIGTLELSITDTTTEDKFIMESTVPTKDEVALTQDGYNFTINNTGTLDSYYTVYLDDIILSDSGERLDNSYVKVNLLNNKTNQSTTRYLSDYEETDRVLTTGMVKAKESVSYTLRMWVDYNVGNVAQNKYFATQIRVVGTQNNAVYQESILNGATPVLSNNLIPVLIADDGTVTKADISNEWYSYEDKRWANAVILKDNKIYTNNEVIPKDNIESYFVWIPKYSYQLFDLGNYSTAISQEPIESNAQEIKIRFGIINTDDSVDGECTTPLSSGESGNCEVEDYMTHPAFITMNTNGMWVAKFKTTGSSNDISILPNSVMLRKISVKTMFELAYNYNRNSDSHMMKNTEWGAVAYLSHSKYGINKEININNNSDFITGYSSTNEADQSIFPGITGTSADLTQPYNTTTGYLASTTGNITGIYDMSGGCWELMASYVDGDYGNSGFNATTIAQYDSKYFDVYSVKSYTTSYNYRILGDATGEMGPFYYYADTNGNSKYHNSWYNDYTDFAVTGATWFFRANENSSGYLAGQFAFRRYAGGANQYGSFRIVLTPTK